MLLVPEIRIRKVFWYTTCMLNKDTLIFSQKMETTEKKDKLDSLLAKKKKLFQVFAVFPFQLKPDELIIDTQKVTILYNEFFGATTAETILLDQIGDIEIDISLLFGALRILSLSHDKQWLKITGLHRNDAIKAKRIIEGLLIAKKEGIDFDDNDADANALADKLEKLGSSL